MTLTATLAALLLAPSASFAQEVKLKVGGAISTDWRYRTETVQAGDWYQDYELPSQFYRSEQIFKLKLHARSRKVTGVADLDLVYLGMPQTELEIGELSQRQMVDPFRIEAHSLYLHARDVGGASGLDLRVGQQLVQWGAGDQFNPTNNLNADDLEDPLKFGDQLGNLMARADYYPGAGLWGVTGVLVPIFKPALLPDTGYLALAALDRIPVVEDELRWQLMSSQAFVKESPLVGFPTIAGDLRTDLPEPTLGNMQFAFNLSGAIGMHDVALSYYRGRHDFPQGVRNHTEMDAGVRCNPADREDCVNGVFKTNVTLAYPRMQVLGFNGAGELNPLGWLGKSVKPLGYRVEAAYIIPEATEIALTNDAFDLGLYQQPAGEFDYGLDGDRRPLVVPEGGFLKWVLGLDYTWNRHVYTNAQWVHGMPDEFGRGDWIWNGKVTRRATTIADGGEDAEAMATLLGCVLASGDEPVDAAPCVGEIRRNRIGDYAVVGNDFMLGDALLRVFAIVDLTGAVSEAYDTESEERTTETLQWTSEEGGSVVLFPEFQYNFGNGFETAVGAMLLYGTDTSKFNEPAAGGDSVHVRAKYSF